MTPEQIRRAIAEVCGYKPHIVEWWVHSDKTNSMVMGGTQRQCLEWRDSLPRESPYRGPDWEVVPRYSDPPDYLNDLNAMHEAEKHLKEHQIGDYVKNLWEAMESSPEAHFGTIHASAAQRAEAFLRTLGLWERHWP